MRTEQDVLNDFKKLGYDFSIFSRSYYLSKEENRKNTLIVIDKELKTYRCINSELGSYFIIGDIKIQEHKLLNELFQIWGWI